MMRLWFVYYCMLCLFAPPSAKLTMAPRLEPQSAPL